uniref:Vigilin 1 n=1 Tax=Panagrellus redivivus TaxID=6233 RepID=A0A7E4VJH2_PANRE
MANTTETAAFPAENGTNGFHADAADAEFGLNYGLVDPTPTNGASNGLAPTPPVDGVPATTTAAPTIASATAPVIMDYSVDFPKLPDAPVVKKTVAPAWGAVRANTVTEAVTFTAEERASKLGKRLGDMSEEQTKCATIAAITGTKIELSEARDHSLTVLISGRKSAVDEARSKLLRDLQTQVDGEIRVAKEFRGALIGKEGSNLRKLEQEFACKINMPNRDEPGNDTIRVHGPPAYVHAALRKIESIVTELAKQATETITIPKALYPWVRGPANENIAKLESTYSVRVNIPPPSSDKDTIVVSGVREGVYAVIAELKNLAASKQNIASITCNLPRSQHRYLLGARRAGIDEILRATDVVVEVPTEEENSDVITLRGDTTRLADALSLVYARATSIVTKEVKYADWQRRFLIGPKGATLASLVPNQDKLKIDFEDGGIVFIEGPPEQVNAAAEALEQEVARLTKELASDVVKVPANLHRHIVGRNGALVNKLKADNDVQITIPDESKGSDEIRVEGKKAGVAKAIAAIKEIVNRLENEKSRDIIIEQRFHGQLIGKAGENINKWRAEFPTVSIAFPDAIVKSDIVNLRGDKKEVDKLHAAITKLNKELLESNFQDTVSIFKEYYKHIIGKAGANINKIREETNTRIELPAQGSPDGRLTVIGKQANVEKAIEKLNKIQNELASIVEEEVTIPNKVHARLLGHGRRLIRDIEDEFGGVHIIFPKTTDKTSDKVTIRGPKDDVARAKKALVDVAKHAEETTEEAYIPTKPEYIKFLIGREGANVKKMREAYPSVRIIFPEAEPAEQRIFLIGKKEEVAAAKAAYEAQIKELNETVEIHVDVNPKYHKHFVVRGAEVIREIQEQNGGVVISFPRQDAAGETKVTIKGSKQCAESAKARIEEIVGDLEAQVTITLPIPNEHHRSIVPHANELRSRFGVRIRFPARGTSNEGAEEGAVLPADAVTITGRDTKVEAAKAALIDLIPVTKTIAVPLDFHSSLIGKGGEAVRQLMTAHAVRVKIPPSSEQNEEIQVTGSAANVDAALETITERMKEYEGQAEDRKLRSHKIDFEIPLKYHQRIIGPGGAHIKEVQARHGVQIKVPRSEENSTTISIIGYEEKANECKAEIVAMVDDLENQVSLEVELDSRFHPRLIGQRGRNLKKIQEEYKVDIRMPGRNDENPNLVVISGKSEDDVLTCIDKLRAQEEDFLDDLAERTAYQAPRHEPAPAPAPRKVQITGAPWQLQSDDFPSMGGADAPAPASSSSGGVWGQRRW